MSVNSRHIFVITIALFLNGITLAAQTLFDESDVTREINHIKTLSNYIYAEATNADKDVAISNATELLKDELRYAVGDSVLTAQALESKRFILTKRGSLTRAFVYTVRPLNISSRREGSMPVMQDADTTEGSYVLFAEETRMVSVKQTDEIGTYVESLNLKNILKDYGKYTDLPANGECYIFVYNKNQEVVACIKRTDERQINLITRQNDDVKNYKNCGAIWFTIK